MEQNHENKSTPVDSKAHLDFLTSIVLLLVCAGAIVTSLGYWKKLGGNFYASPGFMPVIICSALSFMAILLLLRSLKNSSVQQRVQQLGTAFGRTVRSSNVHRGAVGILVFAVYVFVLLGKLPFWLASLITLFAVLMFLQFDKKLLTAVKLLLIAGLSIAAIILLFQFAFSVPMP